MVLGQGDAESSALWPCWTAHKHQLTNTNYTTVTDHTNNYNNTNYTTYAHAPDDQAHASTD